MMFICHNVYCAIDHIGQEVPFEDSMTVIIVTICY